VLFTTDLLATNKKIFQKEEDKKNCIVLSR